MDRLNDLLRKVPVGAVWVAGLIPLAWLVAGAAAGGLGADPVKVLEHRLGLLGLQFLLASLCITPLRWAGLNLLRYRRALGLLAFLHVALHLMVWLVLDMALRWPEIAADLVRRPYVVVGMLGFLAMVPLALTSTQRAIRAMGARAWARLHRLAYLAVAAGAVHFVLQAKTWQAEPLLYAGLAAMLLALRWWKSRPRHAA